MRKTKLLLTILATSMALSSTALAGTWSHTYDTEYGSYTYDNLWFYVKDNGDFAENEWIQDEDGTWYWIDSSGILPTSAGAADDGSLYDSDGKYIDMNDNRKFLTKEAFSSISKGMTHEQVVAVLGKEHEIADSSQSITTYGTYNYMTLKWYSSDVNGQGSIYFTNGLVSYASSYWK